ncbi:hypothetical protein EYV94_21575 [Puteibacter caeruleilacunae]|nr:hypothetical protein EYV94_21575 [Puteibacter caeruleilacunae]
MAKFLGFGPNMEIQFSGKLGNVVGVARKDGTYYVRSMPEKHKDAKSPKQQQQRKRFGAMNKLISRLNPIIIRPIWHGTSRKLPGATLFSKANYQLFDKEGKITDYSKLKMTVGSFAVPFGMRFHNDEESEGVIRIEWSQYIKPNTYAPVKLNALAMCGDDIVLLDNQDIDEENCMAQVSLPFAKGSEVHLYVFFSGNIVPRKPTYSNSHYFHIETL